MRAELLGDAMETDLRDFDLQGTDLMRILSNSTLI